MACPDQPFWCEASGAFVPGILIVLIACSIYYAISIYRKVNIKKHGRWRKESINTNITATEFVERVQRICLIKKHNIVEISEKHAVIRENPSWIHWGVFYYVEFHAAEQNYIDVYARGALLLSTFYRPNVTNFVNLLYKV